MATRTLARIRAADSYFPRLAGLMGKKHWPVDCSGIFFPRCRSVHTFFTFLRPDILFLDKNLKIAKIFPSTKSWRVFGGPPGSLHCLELPAGTARRLGLKAGDPVRFEPQRQWGTGSHG